MVKHEDWPVVFDLDNWPECEEEIKRLKRATQEANDRAFAYALQKEQEDNWHYWLELLKSTITQLNHRRRRTRYRKIQRMRRI